MQSDALINGITGEEPAELITDALAHTPGTGKVFYSLTFLVDTEISAITPAFTGNAMAGVIFKAGTTIPVRCTSITLVAGGQALAQRGSKRG